MKKIISQILLILLIMIVGVVPCVLAADATISVSSTNIKKGDTFTVTVNIPSNAVGYQGTIKIFYKDEGITDSSGLLMKVTGIDGEYTHPGNMTATFTAKSTGEATISVEGCVISDKDTNTLKNPAPISIIVASNIQTPTTPSTPETPSTPTTPTTPSEPSDNPGNGSTSTGNSNTGSTTTEPKFTDVNETVYTTQRCNVRKSYSTDSEKITTLEKDTKLTRKGVGDNGWSKVEHNGQTVYVYSEYLTKTEPKAEEEPEVVFKDTHENLYAKQNCNLRASWSTDSEKVGYLTKGQEVERTGYADNGWSRIIYNGKTVYVASRLLVLEKPEEDEEENTVNNTVENNSVMDENVVDDPTQMSEEDRLKEIQAEVGVLPEVGTNIANIVYVIVTLIAIAGVITGIIYIKKIK